MVYIYIGITGIAMYNVVMSVHTSALHMDMKSKCLARGNAPLAWCLLSVCLYINRTGLRVNKMWLCWCAIVVNGIFKFHE